MVATCPQTSAAIRDESSWLDSDGIHFTAHRIGLAFCGACALLALVISLVNIMGHARSYRQPFEQRQIIRILLMPVVFSIVAFASFVWFREFNYYAIVEALYETVAIAAFLTLMLTFIGQTTAEQQETLRFKDKRSLPFPFCCWRYRPTKAYVIPAVQCSVLQLVVLKPLISLAAIVTEALNLYCVQSHSLKFAHVWLASVDFISVSVALYGLFVMYALSRQELEGKRPLAKFMTIKAIVALSFYQSFLFSWLASAGILRSTDFYSSVDIANGLSAMLLVFEMVFIALFQLYAFPASDYYQVMRDDSAKHTGFWRSMGHALNLSDFFVALWQSVRFFFRQDRSQSMPMPPIDQPGLDFEAAYGLRDSCASRSSAWREKQIMQRSNSDYPPSTASLGDEQPVNFDNSAYEKPVFASSLARLYPTDLTPIALAQPPRTNVARGYAAPDYTALSTESPAPSPLTVVRPRAPPEPPRTVLPYSLDRPAQLQDEQHELGYAL
ncbi:uncharacterized protein L969DRAFT_92624 [Mixia osmundae IAM 14324]|uniref:DUF300-domain-containing protein n=1 Tax=Mixia osmundae (strain CBS 9802 / IAM 14324 / JCM 22182 / KY 12970) TaxID=764103 RepID=G7DY32_MIXOS|nr:uncharacterized protein L969DRAFT_92624 [Mixia osmundae IAM 14324]KEI41394.1 hypothetical protein L969DRAFT_92624 [Mixia osmundae IAM 14324]GAA95492.1 hypothetical protein E5Q_02147 [Mixia osmundae IAM 14324]